MTENVWVCECVCVDRLTVEAVVLVVVDAKVGIVIETDETGFRELVLIAEMASPI